MQERTKCACKTENRAELRFHVEGKQIKNWEYKVNQTVKGHGILTDF